MKQLIEFLPIILFFVIYQMDGSTIDIMGWSHTVDGYLQRYPGLDGVHSIDAALALVGGQGT